MASKHKQITMEEEFSFLSREDSLTSTEEALWLCRHTDNVLSAPFLTTSNSTSGHDSKKLHLIPPDSDQPLPSSMADPPNNRKNNKEECNNGGPTPKNLYDRLYLQPLISDQAPENHYNDPVDLCETPSSLTGPSIQTCSSITNSLDLHGQEDNNAPGSPALTKLENVTKASRALIDKQLLQQHGIGRSAASRMKTKIRRRKNSKKCAAKKNQTSKQKSLQPDNSDLKEPFTSPRDCAIYSPLQTVKSNKRAEEQEREKEGVPSPALTHLEDVTEVSRALIPPEMFKLSKKKRVKKIKKNKRKKNNGRKVCEKMSNSATTSHTRQSTQEEEAEHPGGMPSHSSTLLQQQRRHKQRKVPIKIVSVRNNNAEELQLEQLRDVHCQQGNISCISMESAPMRPEQSDPIEVLSSNSPYYTGSSRALPDRAPLALRVVHELATGLIDAYHMSGVLPRSKRHPNWTLSRLDCTTEMRGEEKHGWHTIQLFLSNLQFLVKLVDTICSTETPVSARQHLKKHAQFRPLRSVIRTANDVITSRFLVQRVGHYRLFFRIVLPQCNEQEGRDAHKGDDIDVMMELNRSVSEAVMFASEDQKEENRPSNSSARVISPFIDEYEADSDIVSGQIINEELKVEPESPPTMLCTSKAIERSAGIEERDDRRYSATLSLDLDTSHPVTDSTRQRNHLPQQQLPLRSTLKQAQGVELRKEDKAKELCIYPLPQDDQRKGKSSASFIPISMPYDEILPTYFTASSNIDASCIQEESDDGTEKIRTSKPEEKADNSSVTSDVHRATTPISANVTPKKVSVSISAIEARNEEGSRELMNIVRLLWDEMVTQEDVEETEIVEESPDDDALDVAFILTSDNESGSEIRQEEYTDDESGTVDLVPVNLSLVYPTDEEYDKDGSSSIKNQESQASTVQPDLLSPRLGLRHQTQPQYGLAEDDVNPIGTTSVLDELEALLAVFRERKRNSAASTESRIQNRMVSVDSNNSSFTILVDPDDKGTVEKKPADVGKVDNITDGVAVSSAGASEEAHLPNYSNNTKVSAQEEIAPLFATKPRDEGSLGGERDGEGNDISQNEKIDKQFNVHDGNNQYSVVPKSYRSDAAVTMNNEFCNTSLSPSSPTRNKYTKAEGQKVQDGSPARTVSTTSESILSYEDEVIDTQDQENNTSDSNSQDPLHELDGTNNIGRSCFDGSAITHSSGKCTGYYMLNIDREDKKMRDEGNVCIGKEEGDIFKSSSWDVPDDKSIQPKTEIISSQNTSEKLLTEERSTHQNDRQQLFRSIGNTGCESMDETRELMMKRDDATATDFDWTCTPVDHQSVSSSERSVASCLSTDENIERLRIKLKKNSERVRERLQKLRENKNNGPLSNTDQTTLFDMKEYGGKRMLATIPIGEPVQQCGDDVDPRILQQQILFLEGLKADKEAAIDRLADTQSVYVPSLKSALSIRTEDKEGILQRNAGAAALELEIQNLSRRLSNLRKKWDKSTNSELQATRHQHSAANSSLHNIEKTDSFLLDSNLVKERKKMTEHGDRSNAEIVHLRMRLRSEANRSISRLKSLQRGSGVSSVHS